MELWSGTVLPWILGAMNWLGCHLRTEVAAAWAQAVFSALAIFASYSLAQRHFDKGNELQLKRHFEEDRQNVVRFRALIHSACGTLTSIRDTAAKYPDVSQLVLAHAYEELIRCSEALHSLAMKNLPNAEIIDSAITFADVIKGYANWLDFNKDKPLGDAFASRVEENIFTLSALRECLEEFIDEHRDDPGAKFQVDYDSLIQGG